MRELESNHLDRSARAGLKLSTSFIQLDSSPIEAIHGLLKERTLETSRKAIYHKTIAIKLKINDKVKL